MSILVFAIGFFAVYSLLKGEKKPRTSDDVRKDVVGIAIAFAVGFVLYQFL